MKIVTWNIACLPRYLNIFSNPMNRIASILNKLSKYDADIICLQEVFDKNIREIIQMPENTYKEVKEQLAKLDQIREKYQLEVDLGSKAATGNAWEDLEK